MKRSLTGIKPSGEIHLGNYLGAIRPALGLAERYESYYFIADYHAMTTVESAEDLRRSSRETAATWLALGLDPARTRLFRQSAIPEVCELAWILGCVVPIGQLERGHAVKAAKDGGFEINVGTWYYPILMSADILLYGSDAVPVGRDQVQHVEIARDIAVKLNHRYGVDTLVVPEASVQADVAVVPGLDGRKMSKSYENTIPLWSDPKQLQKLVGRIKTDSTPMEDPKDPDACNVFQLYRHFASPPEIAALRERYVQGGMGYGHAKQELFEVINRVLETPRQRYHEWLAEPDRLEAVLDDGARRARVAAEQTLRRVRERVGLPPR